jgi:hypothetical protein
VTSGLAYCWAGIRRIADGIGSIRRRKARSRWVTVKDWRLRWVLVKVWEERESGMAGLSEALSEADLRFILWYHGSKLGFHLAMHGILKDRAQNSCEGRCFEGRDGPGDVAHGLQASSVSPCVFFPYLGRPCGLRADAIVSVRLHIQSFKGFLQITVRLAYSIVRTVP